MLIQFNHAFARADELRDAVNKGYLRIADPEGDQADGERFTIFDAKRRICLKDDLDLVVTDTLPEDTLVSS